MKKILLITILLLNFGVINAQEIELEKTYKYYWDSKTVDEVYWDENGNMNFNRGTETTYYDKDERFFLIDGKKNYMDFLQAKNTWYTITRKFSIQDIEWFFLTTKMDKK